MALGNGLAVFSSSWLSGMFFVYQNEEQTE
jgi:hypothetical protein